MSKGTKFSRKRLYASTKWLPFIKEDTSIAELNSLIASEKYESYCILENYKVNEGRFTHFFIDDKIYKFVNNSHNISVVIPILQNSPVKTYIQSEKDLETNGMNIIDNNNQDKKMFPIIIMFKDKKEAAKFKLVV